MGLKDGLNHINRSIYKNIFISVKKLLHKVINNAIQQKEMQYSMDIDKSNTKFLDLK